MSEASALEWTTRLQGLLGKERHTLVEFLLLLGELDKQRLYLELGYAGTWDYVRRSLGQSETMTHYRVTTARLLVRFPQAEKPLREGKLCMTTLATLAKVLTEANCDEILAEAMGKPKPEILRIKARLDPKPQPKDVVRPVGPVLVPAQVHEASAARVPEEPVKSPMMPVRKEILTPEFTRRHMTTDAEFEDLLRQARAALSHKMPEASELDILKEGLREILRHKDQRKGLVKRPRAPKPSVEPPGGKQAIPAHVMREVWLRDQGRCQWPTADGGICGSTVRVEFHHIQDRGKGGPHTVSNGVLVCAIHNGVAADRVWGKEFMDQFRSPFRGGWP